MTTVILIFTKRVDAPGIPGCQICSDLNAYGEMTRGT